MQVEEKKAAAKVEHMGKTYYFCSESCKRAFEKDPHKSWHTGGAQASLTRFRASRDATAALLRGMQLGKL